jgi:hypothetical protein
MQRLYILATMPLLLGYGADASAIILPSQTIAHDEHSIPTVFPTLRAAMAFFLVARLLRLIFNLVYAFSIPKVLFVADCSSNWSVLEFNVMTRADLIYLLHRTRLPVVILCPAHLGQFGEGVLGAHNGGDGRPLHALYDWTCLGPESAANSEGWADCEGRLSACNQHRVCTSFC